MVLKMPMLKQFKTNIKMRIETTSIQYLCNMNFAIAQYFSVILVSFVQYSWNLF